MAGHTGRAWFQPCGAPQSLSPDVILRSHGLFQWQQTKNQQKILRAFFSLFLFIFLHFISPRTEHLSPLPLSQLQANRKLCKLGDGVISWHRPIPMGDSGRVANLCHRYFVVLGLKRLGTPDIGYALRLTKNIPFQSGKVPHMQQAEMIGFTAIWREGLGS